MSVISKSPRILLLLAMLTGTASASLAAQQQDPSDADISAAVYSSPSPEAAEMAEGPEIEGIISARSGDGMQVTTADGTNTVIAINDATRIKASGGLDRKSTRLNPVTNAQLVCRLTLEKKTKERAK